MGNKTDWNLWIPLLGVLLLVIGVGGQIFSWGWQAALSQPPVKDNSLSAVTLNNCLVHWDEGKLREEFSSNDGITPCEMTVQPNTLLWFTPDFPSPTPALDGCKYGPDYYNHGECAFTPAFALPSPYDLAALDSSSSVSSADYDICLPIIGSNNAPNGWYGCSEKTPDGTASGLTQSPQYFHPEGVTPQILAAPSSSLTMGDVKTN